MQIICLKFFCMLGKIHGGLRFFFLKKKGIEEIFLKRWGWGGLTMIMPLTLVIQLTFNERSHQKFTLNIS